MKLVYNDASHTYTLNGKRVKSASKVAGIAADKFTVEQWGKRMVAIGMTLRPDLIERVAVDLDNKTAIQEVCSEAHTAAKGNARAERGTQRHRVLELSLLGQHDQFITPQQLADAEVLARTLDAYRLEPVPGYVEQFIAYPDHGVVGRFDAVLRRDGVPGLYDLKGGENAVKYPHSTLTQLALYLFAPNVSARIERDGDRSTVTEWTTMPDGIDTDTAYVIYCDDHHDVGELWALDMRHGREGADLALQIVDWRKKHRYGDEAVKKIEATPLNAGQAARLEAIKAEPPTERPPDETATDKVTRPDTPVGKKLDQMDAATSKLEGGPPDPADLNTIRARIKLGLSQPQTAWINYLRTVISPGLTERRANIYCAITKLVASDLWDDQTAKFNEIVQALVDSVSKSKKPRKLSTAIAGLTLAQSAALRAAVDNVINDVTLLELDPSSGVLRMRAVA